MLAGSHRFGCQADPRADASIRPYNMMAYRIVFKNYFLIGHKLSALIMAQRAAESFSVIFIWRQLGR